jgi:hypothetical protein
MTSAADGVVTALSVEAAFVHANNGDVGRGSVLHSACRANSNGHNRNNAPNCRTEHQGTADAASSTHVFPALADLKRQFSNGLCFRAAGKRWHCILTLRQLSRSIGRASMIGNLRSSSQNIYLNWLQPSYRLKATLGIHNGDVRGSLVIFTSDCFTSAVRAGQPPHLVAPAVSHKECRLGVTVRHWSGAQEAALVRLKDA